MCMLGKMKMMYHLKPKGPYSVPSRLKDPCVTILLELHKSWQALQKQNKLSRILKTRRKQGKMSWSIIKMVLWSRNAFNTPLFPRSKSNKCCKPSKNLELIWKLHHLLNLVRLIFKERCRRQRRVSSHSRRVVLLMHTHLWATFDWTKGKKPDEHRCSLSSRNGLIAFTRFFIWKAQCILYIQVCWWSNSGHTKSKCGANCHR